MSKQNPEIVEPTEGWYFSSLIELVVTDQAAITHADFERMLKAQPEIRFVYGRSGGFSLAAGLLGLNRNSYFDTFQYTPPGAPKKEHSSVRMSGDDGYGDYFGDDDDWEGEFGMIPEHLRNYA